MTWLGALLVIFLYPVTAFAGGSEAGNGGGLAEKNVMYAYLELATPIDLCLASSVCRVGADEQAALRAIRGSLAQEYASPGQVQFRSEKAAPGFFMVDGALRIAKTGDTVGSPIYVNLDLMYPVDAAGNVQPMSIALATCVLVHELGHHHGIKDHTWLDLVGSKVEALLLKTSQDVPLTQWTVPGERIAATALETHAPGAFDELLLSARGELVKLTPLLRSKLRCQPFGANLPATEAGIANVHWKRGFNDDAGVFQQGLALWFTARCAGGMTEEGGVTLTLSFEKDAQGYALDLAHSQFLEVPCTAGVFCVDP
jgi:hypothetical protein